MTCLIVEDEPLAAEVLGDYIRQVPHLSLAGICPDAMSAMEFLSRQRVELMFLDIHLPGMKGLDFLKTIRNAPSVILTTAYHQYALQGYEHDVVDYLLKPIEFSRFLEAVNKVQRRTTVAGSLTVHSGKKEVVIPTEDIHYVESQREYVHIFTTSGVVVSKMALARMETMLDPSRFLRVHRSFIVAAGKVKAYTSSDIDVQGKMIPIGRNYRQSALQRLKSALR